MNSTKTSIVPFLVIALALIMTSESRAQFDLTAKWVPSSANTIVMIRAKKILDSEFAKLGKWNRKNGVFETGISFGPGKTERMLMSSQMDFEFMEPLWTVCIFEKFGAPIDMIDITKQIGGSLDELYGKPALLLLNDAFVVSLDSNTLGSFYPANRQVVTKWLQAKQDSQMNLSPYLTEAVRFADNNADLIMALDFESVAHPKLVHDQLSAICDKEKMDDVCQAVCNIKGVTIGVTIREKVTGSMKIDFGGSISGFSQDAKKFVFEILAKNGVMIDDLKSWEFQVSDNQIRLTGPLSISGLRKVGSLIHHPVSHAHAQAKSMNKSVDTKTRSLQYFRDINKITHDLRMKKSSTMRTYAYWYGRYARMIDELPVVGVDPQLLAYGRFVANSYRQATRMLRAANYEKVLSRSEFSDVTDSYFGVDDGYGDYGGYDSYGGYSPYGAYGGYGTYGAYGGYGILDGYGYDYGYGPGYGYGRANYSSSIYGKYIRLRKMAGGQAKIKGFNSADEVIADVADETAKIRIAMSLKYKTEF